jgi:hypothetical protein
MSLPSSGSKNKLCLPPAFTLVPCSAYFSTLKTEVICFSETSVDFQRTTRRYIQEDDMLQKMFSLLLHPERFFDSAGYLPFGTGVLFDHPPLSSAEVKDALS